MPRRLSSALTTGVLAALAVVPCVALAQGTSAQIPGAKASGLYVAHVTLQAAKPRGSGNGSVTVCLDTTTNTISFAFDQLLVPDRPTAGHIHRGAAGTSGPVVFPFGAAGSIDPLVGDIQWYGTGKSTKGTIASIIASPAKHYVNVHTKRYPNGTMRGQLGALKRVQPDNAAAVVCGAD